MVDDLLIGSFHGIVTPVPPMANTGQPLTSAEWPGGWRKATTRHPGRFMRQDVGVDGDAARTPLHTNDPIKRSSTIVI